MGVMNIHANNRIQGGSSRSFKAFALFLLSTLQLQLLSRPNGAVQVQAIEQNTFRAVRMLRKANEEERKQQQDRESESSSSLRGPATAQEDKPSSKAQPQEGVYELWFEQRLDHFRSDPRTFSQRFFYSNKYVHTDDGNKDSTSYKEYAFLCCGGEGPDLDASVLVDSVHCSGDMLELASILFQHHNASVHLYALEHRYYGQSYPTFPDVSDDDETSSSPVTNENLVYLSSRQAVADIGHFISVMQQQHGQHDPTEVEAEAEAPTDESLVSSTTVPWVTFGGSYPGVVAAYARLKFPHAVTAAVSNSAPLQAQLDFPEYNQHVAVDLSNPLIGGSDECLDVFVTGHAMLASMVQDEANHETIAQAFGLCDATALQNKMNAVKYAGPLIRKTWMS